MATKYIEASTTTAGDTATQLAQLALDTPASVTPILYDPVDGVLKYYDRVASLVRQVQGVGMAPINCTTATLAVTAALHAGRTVTLSKAAGIAVTLPAATGTGNRYRFVVAITFTGASTIKVANATDYFIGVALLNQDGGATVVGFATANTGTVATEDDTIDMLGTSNSTGGFKGEVIEIEDIATAVFSVRVWSEAGGTEATPFSSGV